MWSKKWSKEIWPQFERHFSEHEYASISGQFTYLDCMVAHLLMWARKYEVPGLLAAAPPAVAAYRKRMAQRPAYKRATVDAAEFEQDSKF